MNYCMYCRRPIKNNIDIEEAVCASCTQKIVGTELTDQQKSTQLTQPKPRRATNKKKQYPSLPHCPFCKCVSLEEVCPRCGK